ncbi:hypothetical protein ACPOL_0234 [Acidisarcina polymorpha]|uniref:Uncharacterized protein n=1 Tax=Acidisarcina polymorpha TaxID=2211140 RepID=A0A2Z5FS76_9BACT|nr:hypothetical protein ACPOL_0234 [Acidisarcina polymorpha]
MECDRIVAVLACIAAFILTIKEREIRVTGEYSGNLFR